ncbi:hypothetical protein QFZ60_001609 [Arthrobacter sp. B2I5]|nr:hypothetical protein [Arthrobacter sp. B2I5]
MTPSVSPNRTSAVKGLRTGIQAAAGALLALVTVVWAVPGVPEAVMNWLSTNAVQLLIAIGAPSGLVSWLWNAYEASRK